VLIDESWWRTHLADAWSKRDGMFDDKTTGYRCLHGEGDGWPGLVLDRYESTFVLKLYTAAWLERLGDITKLLRDYFHPERLVLRLSRNIQSAALKNGHSDGQFLFGAKSPPEAVFRETGLRFEADVVRGQKTGFFLDQRDNRRRVEQLAAGRSVLNAFSFSGGFSLYAARGGARSVTDLDISAHALQSAQRNFALNKDVPELQNCAREAIQADAFEWLASNAGKTFGLLILDPPALAKKQSERNAAIQAYRRLIQTGIRHLDRDGILVAASCSAHVTATEFFSIAEKAARQSGRCFREIGRSEQPPDHPATFEQGKYLKCVYYQFDLRQV
jgi:23S rRNA (cytosine1962-C5)-methyltransferase